MEKKLQCIAFSQIEQAADFFGNYDPAKIIHSSDNTGFFHAAFFLLIFASVGRIFTLVVAKVTCRTLLSPRARML